MSNQVENKILVFGGGFNPPTVAHQAIMQACLELPSFDEVWVMPSGNRTDKNMSVSNQNRIDMLNLIRKDEFNNNPRLLITNFELSLPVPTQTYRTVGALATAYPQTEFWYVYGADAYHSMHTWDRGDELKRDLKLVITDRDDLPLPNDPNHIHIELGHFASSTTVREAVAEGRSVDEFVCQSVKNYIIANKLYGHR